MDLDDFYLYESIPDKEWTEDEKKSAWIRIRLVFYIYFSLIILIMFFTTYNIQITTYIKKIYGKLYIYFKTYKITHDYDPDENCSICLDTFGNKNIIKLQCNHNFHKKCIYQWFHINITCPLCRNR